MNNSNNKNFQQLDAGYSNATNAQILMMEISKDNKDNVMALLADSSTVLESGHLLLAIQQNHEWAIPLILVRKDCDPSDENNEALKMAANRQDMVLLGMLFSHPLIDPGFGKNYMIKYLADCGYTRSVERFIADPRVDASADGNLALKNATKRGYKAIEELLLGNTKVVSLLNLVKK
jgi:hypothetical protein